MEYTAPARITRSARHGVGLALSDETAGCIALVRGSSPDEASRWADRVLLSVLALFYPIILGNAPAQRSGDGTVTPRCSSLLPVKEGPSVSIKMIRGLWNGLVEDGCVRDWEEKESRLLPHPRANSR